MSLAVTRQEWKKVLGKLEGDLREIVSVDDTISDETTFREKFLALPRDGHVGDPDKNYGSFTRFHEPMLFFGREIDSTLGLVSPEALRTVFWTVTFIALQTLFEKKYVYSEIEEDIYKDLNEKIRLKQTELAQFPRSSKVQKCLQEIFQRYIACYIKLIAQAQELGDDEDDDIDMTEEIESAGSFFEIKQKEWEERCEEAKREVAPPEDDARWEFARSLGRGTYGSVDAVYEAGTGSLYARKSIRRKLQGISEQKIEQRIRNEVEIMQKLGHKHIARVTLLLRSDQYWSIFMLPVADCDLGTFLSERCVGQNYPHEEIRMIDRWFGCLVAALAYAHSESIRHEDIKPTNVLIKGQLVLLTDFGTAIDFSEAGISTADGHNEQGTPVYWPPENRPYGRAADVFALGCVFAEMLTVRQKHSLDEFRQWRYNSSKEYGYAFRSNLPKVKRYLKERIGIQQNDYVFRSLLEQIFNMLVEDPDQRSPARTIRGRLKEHEERLFCSACA